MRRYAFLVPLFAVAVIGVVLFARAEETDDLTIEVITNGSAIPPYEVFEITFQHDRDYADPFFDVVIEVSFESPSGESVKVGGFHYGSSSPPVIRATQDAQGRRHVEYVFEKQDLWKARFTPNEIGTWRYSYIFANREGTQATGGGEFECLEGRVRSHGFLRQNPTNPFRWVFDDGTPCFPIGLQECLGDGSGTGSVLDTVSLEGPFRTDRTNLTEMLPGPLYVRGPSMNPQNGDVYFRRYGQAGFNLFRFSQRNCSYDLYRDLDHYLAQEGVMTDELLVLARKYGFRMMYGLFGYQKVFNDEPENSEGMEKVKRFIKYSVDRWGAYVDFWEFLNEQKAADGWYAIMIPYLRSIDPYHHPITTSWERPELDGIEINAPHWYQNENELESDSVTVSRARKWKQYDKPVVVGEQGNHVGKRESPRPPGVGGVWDAGSAPRMRIRCWTALFQEIAFVFWNTSYARDGHYMNIWLGPQERQYIRAMQDFADGLDADVAMASVQTSHPDQVRAYGLTSEKHAGVYLHHYADHTTVLQGISITLDVPLSAKGYWYAPEDGTILSTIDVSAGRQTVECPPFAVDLALLITLDERPDRDHDGIANDADPDDDNDGVADTEDAFPLEPEEWADQDRDLIGDNLDADDDGDGLADDQNANGVPDHEELDFDGDGVDRAKSVPWDAFPFDSTEWRDTDGDGIGDNADTDDDGDGWSDEEERQRGTDPLNKLSFLPTEENAHSAASLPMTDTDDRNTPAQQVRDRRTARFCCVSFGNRYTQDDFRHMAEKLDLLILDPYNYRQVPAVLKETNPDIKVFGYCNTFDIQDMTRYEGRERAPESKTARMIREWRDADANDWFYRDEHGQRVNVYLNKTDNRYGLDLGKPQVRAFLAAKAKTIVDQGYDGVFLDNVGVRYPYGYGVGEWVSAVPTGLTEQQWWNDSIEMLHAIKQAVGDKAVVFNQVRGYNPEVSLQFVAEVDGAMDEDWLSNGNFKPQQWREDVSLIQRLNKLDQITLPIARGNSEQVARALFASYLLAKDGEHAYFAYGPYNFTQWTWFPFYDLDLGKPLADCTYEGDVYQRRYERGLVLVNTVDRPRDVTLTDGYGSELGEPVRHIELAGRTGALLSAMAVQ